MIFFLFALSFPLIMRRPLSVNILIHLLRIAVGALFLYTGIGKVTDIVGTAQTITQADFLPIFFSTPLAYLGVAMEIVLGFCLLFKRHYPAATLWANLLCSVFLFMFVQAWIRGLDMTCNCLVMNKSAQEYPLEVSLRLILLGATLCLTWDAANPTPSSKRKRKLDFSKA